MKSKYTEGAYATASADLSNAYNRLYNIDVKSLEDFVKDVARVCLIPPKMTMSEIDSVI